MSSGGVVPSEKPIVKEKKVRFRVQMKLPESVLKAIKEEAKMVDKSEARVVARKLRQIYGKG